MSGAQRGAGSDDSKGFGPGRSPLPTVLALRAALAAAGLTGAVLLLVATFTTIIQITVSTTDRAVEADTAQSGWDRHGPALILLALLAVWLLAMALRQRSRVAMAGVAVVGLVALAIAWHWDRPHVHDTGSVGEVYLEATAAPGAGYYLETLGGALVLLAGGGLLVLGRAPIAAPGAPGARAASAGERSLVD